MEKKIDKQTVLIGLGGTGSRVVNNVAKMLRKNKISINDGYVTCAVMDTNQSDNRLITSTGTNIPVIPTCDERTIDEYLHMYAGKSPSAWFPYSRSLGAESMIDGASEMRAKSRIAFMDTMESGKIIELRNAIEKVFHHKPGTPEKIRVMLVSSLSGGTGAGMFIQVALWLRKFFDERGCMATIRGIFLLPDIFIRTIPNIRDNPRKPLYHYANAYAAIRELNAINKAIKSKGKSELERPIVIDGLFDSRKPGPKPVFDNAFFIDDIDAGGAAFDKCQTYEEIVAQIVYMQLYAPMHSELSSVEDNLFRAFESNPEPVYGSCGTSKAEYPVDDVVEYCALRAAQESVSEGWCKIDAEIDAIKQEEEEQERDGIVLKHKINRRDTFVRLFDELSSKSGNEVSRGTRLFVSIRHDADDEIREKVPGKENETKITYRPKVKKFMDMLDKEVERAVSTEGGLEQIQELIADLPKPEDHKKFNDKLIERLKKLPDAEIEIRTQVLDDFDKKYEEFANEIIRAIIPLDMSALNSQNEKSLYGLFVKHDPDKGDYFVHPIAAKYMLYRLSQSIEEAQKTLAPSNVRDSALEGSTDVSFDNPETRKKETMKEYWTQLGFVTSKDEIAHYIRKYKEYNTANMTLCMQYENELLKQKVLKDLNERVNALISKIEELFTNFPKLLEKVSDMMEENVKRNEQGRGKTLYVFAQREHKEAKYKELNIDLSGRNGELNRDVINTIYGKFCAQYRPNVKENARYVESNVIALFLESILNSYKTMIPVQYKEQVRLDIIKAIKEESDFDFEAAKAAQMEEGEEKNDVFSQESAAEAAAFRHNTAILSYRNRLGHMATPFLRAQPDEALAVVDNIDGITYDENNMIWMKSEDGSVLRMPFQTKLTFWGFNPKTAENCPELTAALGANTATAADDGYPRNELYCYSSIYGVKAEAIDKFNEQLGGDYYKHYSAVIGSMIRNNSEIDTPHIDKTWHEFLPYVSATRQKVAAQKFFKAFWRAIAYGVVRLDSHGKYEIGERMTDSYGNSTYRYEALLDDNRTIPASDVGRLISALKNHPNFESIITGQLEAMFNEDVRGMTTYVSTDIVRGMVREGDLNPVTMIVRYEASRDYNSHIGSDLVGSIGEIMKDVASNYDMNRGDDQINDARFKLCHRIYEKSTMSRKAVLFESWIKEFRRLKLKVEEDVNPTANGEIEDII